MCLSAVDWLFTAHDSVYACEVHLRLDYYDKPL